MNKMTYPTWTALVEDATRRNDFLSINFREAPGSPGCVTVTLGGFSTSASSTWNATDTHDVVVAPSATTRTTVAVAGQIAAVGTDADLAVLHDDATVAGVDLH